MYQSQINSEKNSYKKHNLFHSRMVFIAYITYIFCCIVLKQKV